MGPGWMFEPLQGTIVHRGECPECDGYTHHLHSGSRAGSSSLAGALEDREAFYVRQANEGLLRGSMTSTYREERNYM